MHWRIYDALRNRLLKTINMENGNIIEFLLGEKAFNGIWFGDHNGKPFWWRKHLREYMNQQGSINTNVVRPVSDVRSEGELLQGEAVAQSGRGCPHLVTYLRGSYLVCRQCGDRVS